MANFINPFSPVSGDHLGQHKIAQHLRCTVVTRRHLPTSFPQRHFVRADAPSGGVLSCRRFRIR